MVARTRSKAGDSDQTHFWEKVGVMADIAAVCHTGKPDRATYTTVLERIKPFVPFDAATLYLLDREHRRLEEAATLSQRVDILEFMRLGTGNGLAAWVAEDGKPIMLSERNEVEGFNPETDFATVLAVPLRFAGASVGVVVAGCRKPRALADKHKRLLQLIADQLAVAVERRQFEQTLLRKHQELTDAQAKLKAAQKQIVAQERLAGVVSLAAEVSHQVNNPLAVIVGNVQCLLLEQQALDQKAISRLQRIEEAAVRIRDVNRRLRDIGRIVGDCSPNAPAGHSETVEPQVKR